MANGVKILTLTYKDFDDLVSLTIGNGVPDTDTNGEPELTLDHLRSQGWEPMCSIPVKILNGYKMKIVFKETDE